MLNIAVIQLWVLFSTVVHELGHAFAGRIMGMRVFDIEIGKGRVVFEFMLGGFRWRFRSAPFGGIARSLPYTAKFFRIKKCFTVLCGPLANAVLLFIAIKLLPLDDFWKPTIFNGFVPMLLLVLSNVILLLFSLWPSMVTSSAGKLPSDGLQLFWKIWRLTKTDIKNILAYRYFYEAQESCLKKDLSGAQKWIEAGLRDFADNFQLKLSAAGILYQQQELCRSHAWPMLCLLDAIKNCQIWMALILNDIAYAYILMSRRKCLSRLILAPGWP